VKEEQDEELVHQVVPHSEGLRSINIGHVPDFCQDERKNDESSARPGSYHPYTADRDHFGASSVYEGFHHLGEGVCKVMQIHDEGSLARSMGYVAGTVEEESDHVVQDYLHVVSPPLAGRVLDSLSQMVSHSTQAVVSEPLRKDKALWELFG